MAYASLSGTGLQRTAPSDALPRRQHLSCIDWLQLAGIGSTFLGRCSIRCSCSSSAVGADAGLQRRELAGQMACVAASDKDSYLRLVMEPATFGTTGDATYLDWLARPNGPVVLNG